MIGSIRLTKAYHGTASQFPWTRLDPDMIGRGLVGNRSPGHFFSTSFHAAKYFSNHLIAEMLVPVVKEVDNFEDLRSSYVPTIIKDVIDGDSIGDTIYVPKSWANLTWVLRWHLWTDEEDYFDSIDDTLNIPEDDTCSRSDLIHLLNMTKGEHGGDFEYAAAEIPQIKKYVEL